MYVLTLEHDGHSAVVNEYLSDQLEDAKTDARSIRQRMNGKYTPGPSVSIYDDQGRVVYRSYATQRPTA